MNKILLMACVLLTSALSFASNKVPKLNITETVILDGTDENFRHAERLVNSSECTQVYIYHYEKLFTGLFQFKDIIVAHTVILKSKENSDSYISITSNEETQKGFGISKIGAFDLTRCEGFLDINK